MTQFSTCSYNTAKKSIAFSPAPSPDPDWHKQIPWYEWAAAIPILVFLGPIVAAIVTGIVDGVIAAVTTGIANSVTHSGATGGLNGLSQISVTWPGSSAVTVEACGLSSAFFVRGAIA